jgi:hypothetical protein
VTYRPLENGRASVDAVVVERPRAPATLSSVATIGARMLTDRELRLWTANLSSSGDMLTASWRWWENRPRYALAYALPAPFGGILSTDVFYDEETYAGIENTVAERRKGGVVTLADWTRTGLRWNAGIGVDAWRGRGRTVMITAGADQRLAADRVSLRASAGALAGSFSSWTAGLGAEWRSRARHEGHVALLRGGLDLAGVDAPRALWPGAGLGEARPLLLRAHPLLDDGVINGDVFGRRVTHASGEWRRWFRPGLKIVPMAPALFVDVARADDRLQPGAAWHADAGIGLRIAVPGGQVLRVDVARGLRDSATVFSVGWTR